MSEHVSLAAYEAAERATSMEEGRIGILVHTGITLVVSVALVLINLFVAPEFPWSAIAVGGMVIGVLVHYLAGYRWLGRQIDARQRRIERRAAGLSGG